MSELQHIRCAFEAIAWNNTTTKHADIPCFTGPERNQAALLIAHVAISWVPAPSTLLDLVRPRDEIDGYLDGDRAQPA